MTEELMHIDRSALEQLARIRRDEEVLRERLAKAEAAQSTVSPVVYERVIGDYRTKLDAIERQSQPLKADARREYAKLKSLTADYQAALQNVTVDREELAFRNQLGEFAEDEFAAMMAELDRSVAEQQGRVDAAAALRTEFVAAFLSEDELEASPLLLPSDEPPPEEPAPAEPAPADRHAPRRRATVAAPQRTVADTIPSTMPGTMPVSAPPATPSAPDPAPPPAPAAEPATEVGVETIATRPAAPMAPDVKEKVTRRTDSGATTVFSMPRLVSIVNGQPGDEYVLKGRTSIGRTAKNDIQVFDDSVSRMHCEVVVERDGFRLVDLGSHNGVAVNGEKVKEKVLADGDIVDVGTRRFIFRFG